MEHIVDRLEPRSAPFQVPDCPTVTELPGMLHLETPLQCDLLTSDPFDLISALHPTPAVGGLPQQAAIQYIARHEKLLRGLYTGVLGFTSHSMSRCIVPLRGGIIAPNAAYLFAGAGLVESSDPAAELEETGWKLERMRRALAQAAKLDNNS